MGREERARRTQAGQRIYACMHVYVKGRIILNAVGAGRASFPSATPAKIGGPWNLIIGTAAGNWGLFMLVLCSGAARFSSIA